MNDFLDKGFNTLITAMRDNVFILSEVYVKPAKLLAATFCLIYFAIEAYKYMTGAKQWDILAILKPFALGGIILGWTGFIHIIDAPFRALESYGMEYINNNVTNLESQMAKRIQKMDSLGYNIFKKEAEVEMAKNEQDSEQADKAGVDRSWWKEKLAKLTLWTKAKVNEQLYSFFEGLTRAIWQGAYFFIRCLQVLYLCVLSCIGPISWSLSLLPWFKDTWIYWLSHYIKASLYGVCTQICLFVAMCIQRYAVTVDLKTLDFILGDETAQVTTSSTVAGNILLYTIALIISIMAIFTVPTMAGWVVQSAAASAGDSLKSGVTAVAQVVSAARGGSSSGSSNSGSSGRR